MKKNKLCVRNEERELHIYIGDNPINDEFNLVATYDNEEMAYGTNIDGKEPLKEVDWFMGYIGRDTQNWFTYDIVIHWGVHEWKFYNRKNIDDIEKDEFTKNLEDIQMNYDVEWK